MKPYAFGIDIGGTTVKCGFFSTDGKFLDSWEIKTRTEDNGAKILPDIADAIKSKMKDAGITAEQVEGVGVGVPGPVSADGLVTRCVNLGWGQTDVCALLSDLLDGMHVEVGNDANVAALGEQWRGGGQGFKNVVMITLGTGVGGGIILDGKIVPGVHGAGGEIGHMQMRKTETAVCGCGKKGCLEQYTSANGIVRVAKLELAKNDTPTPLRDIENLTSKDVLDYAKTGDKVSLKLLDNLGEMLGVAIAHVTCVVDPDVVVIGGGVSKAGQILIDAIVKHYKASAFSSCKDTTFKLAVLGNNAGMYGAVRMVIND